MGFPSELEWFGARALVCGLNVHKESTYTTILDPDGEIVTQKRMPNEEVPDFLKPHSVEKVARAKCNTIILVK